MKFRFLLLVLGIFCFSTIIQISESYSETREIAIVVDPPQNSSSNDNTKNNESEETSNASNHDEPSVLPTEFVTGSEYALNGIPIFIQTSEGIALNEQLLDQIELEKLETIHGKKFWERVETLTNSDRGLVTALLNPQTANSFFSEGGKYEINPKSNLEYYILERGFDPEDTENIPNRIFNPAKYDLARAIAQKLENSNSNELNIDALNDLDLRLVSPHTFQLSNEEEFKRYTSDVQQRASNMLRGALSGTSLSNNQIPGDSTSDDPNSSQTDDDVASSINTKNENLFQNTEHIKQLVENENFSPNYSQNQELEYLSNSNLLLIIIFVIATATLALILKNKKKSAPKTMVAEKKPMDYTAETQKLLISANETFLKGNTKNAFTKFSHAIRFYYSHKLEFEREIISSELLDRLHKENSPDYDFIRDCLVLSGSIEFAKDDSFEKFSSYIKKFSENLGLNIDISSSKGGAI